jgi:serine/threonine protein kinase/Tfp pilus assembly protein PilF
MSSSKGVVVAPLPSPIDPEEIPTIRNRAAGRVPGQDVSKPVEVSQRAAAERFQRAFDQLPVVSQRFAGFELVAILGRGTFGRVYLARQGDLADRFVVLKISPDLSGESRTLARLQHTNIVPIYSVHRVDPFQAVCMPYFGSTTLGQLLARYRDRASLPSTGRQLVDTLCVLNAETDVPSVVVPAGSHESSGGSVEAVGMGPESDGITPVRPPTLPERPKTQGFLALLRGMSYTDAVCWIGSQVADGLGHAHGLGVIHNDLKPANVLLTDDGQPMLLDFGVADDLVHRGLSRSIGGTLPYMSPEHIESTRTLIPMTDPRSDIYGLGLVLFELLTGRHAFRMTSRSDDEELERTLAERRAGPPRIRPFNPAVSPGLEAIVRKCLEPDPVKRYQSAADLREDLDRHRTNRPLKHIRVPSVRERLQKWARRHPRLSSNITLAIATLLVTGFLIAGLFARESRIERYQNEIAARIQEDRARSAADGLEKDVKAAHDALHTRMDDPSQVEAAIERCEGALARFELPENEHWDHGPMFRALSGSEQAKVRDLLVEDCLLLSRGYTLRNRPQKNGQDDTDRALRMNQLAESVAGKQAPRAVWEQRTYLLTKKGRHDEAAQAKERARITENRTASDYFLSGSDALASGRTREALELLTRAIELDPGSYRVNTTLAACYDRLALYSNAAAFYTTAIALRPDLWEGYYNRGLEDLKQGNYKRALADFDRAAQLDPNRPETYLHRSFACENLKDYAAAIRDLDRALELGASKARVLSMRARARGLSGDKEGWKRDLDEALRTQPTDDVAWLARGLARVAIDLPGALQDFDSAIAMNPRSISALQNKAHVLSKLNRTGDAIRVLDRILEVYPEYVKARAGRGVMHARAENWAEAKADAEEALRRDTSPANVYQIAGIYARLTQHDSRHLAEAIRLLSSSLRSGFGYEYIETDKELDPIRATPEFKGLMNGVKALKEIR